MHDRTPLRNTTSLAAAPQLLPPDRPELGTLGGHRVLALIAAPPEYGGALAERLPAVRIGVGPIEAAIATTRALQVLAARNDSPELVLSLGSAGSRTLEQTRVYQVECVRWRDMDATAIGVPRGCTPFLDLPAVLPLPCPIDTLPRATLSTGSDIVTGDAWKTIETDLVDMETFAVLRACQSFSMPLVGLRGVSDGAQALRRYDDWAAALPAVDARLAEAVGRLAAALETGGVPRFDMPANPAATGRVVA